jgi:hypothetical protein
MTKKSESLNAINQDKGLEELSEGIPLFNTTRYLLNLNCTYKELMDWINKEYPEALLKEKGVGENKFELALSPTYFDPNPKISPAVLSFIRFEVLRPYPLDLEGIHYWIFDNSQDKVREFIARVNNTFPRFDIVNVIEIPSKLGRSRIEANDWAYSELENGRLRPEVFKEWKEKFLLECDGFDGVSPLNEIFKSAMRYRDQVKKRKREK